MKPDNVSSHLLKVFREADRHTGINRESLLLYAITQVFESHAVTEEDWKSCSQESRDRWFRQMSAVLDHLEFCTAGAGSYTGHSDIFTEKVQSLKNQIGQLQAKEEELQICKRELEGRFLENTDRLSKLQGECQTIHQQIESASVKIQENETEIKNRKQTLQIKELEKERLSSRLNDLIQQEENLEKNAVGLKQNIQKHEEKLKNLNEEISRKRHEINRQETDIQELTREFNLLTSLQKVLNERHQIEKVLGADKVHCLIDSGLIPQMDQHQEKLGLLLEEIHLKLQEADSLLAKEIGLKQDQWEEIRNHLDKSSF